MTDDAWTQYTVIARTLPGVLMPDECESVKQAALAVGLSRSAVTKGKRTRQSSKRTSNDAVLARSPETDWLYERIRAVGEKLNAEHWRFALTGMASLQVLRYRPLQRFRWHFDASFDRKLTCVVNLAAPETCWRGKLEIKGGHHDRSLAQLQGSATVFPSYLLHRAKAPWWGERWSLVAWFTGPPLV